MGNGRTETTGTNVPSTPLQNLPDIVAETPAGGATPPIGSEPTPIDAAAAAQDLKNLVNIVVGLAGLMDKEGKIPPEKAVETAQLLADEAEKKKDKDPLSAARYLQDAVALNPSDNSLKVKAAYAWLAVADKQKDKPEVIGHALKTGLGFIDSIETSGGQNPEVAEAKFVLNKSMVRYCITYPEHIGDASLYLSQAIHNGTPEFNHALLQGLKEYPHPEIFPVIGTAEDGNDLHMSAVQFFAEELVAVGRPTEARQVYLDQAEAWKDSDPKLAEGMKFLADQIEVDPAKDLAEILKFEDADYQKKVDEDLDANGHYKNPTKIDEAKSRIKDETFSFLHSDAMKGIEVGSAEYDRRLSQFLGKETEYTLLPQTDKKSLLDGGFLIPQDPYKYYLKVEKGDANEQYLKSNGLERKALYLKFAGDDLLGIGKSNAEIQGVSISDRMKTAIRFYNKSLEFLHVDGTD